MFARFLSKFGSFLHVCKACLVLHANEKVEPPLLRAATVLEAMRGLAYFSSMHALASWLEAKRLVTLEIATVMQRLPHAGREARLFSSEN
jgi:hypothetical protein